MTQDSKSAKPAKPRPQPAEAPQPAPQAAKPIRVIVTYGCAMLDPVTGQMYTSHPTKVQEHSVWLDVQLTLGHLRKVV